MTNDLPRSGRVLPSQPDDDERPGDPACWLRRVCPNCGSVADADPPTVCPACHAEIPAD